MSDAGEALESCEQQIDLRRKTAVRHANGWQAARKFVTVSSQYRSVARVHSTLP